MIITRTPYRISFFGGGSDYPTWIREHGGCVLATSIDKYCYITCRRLPPFFEHRHRVVYSLIENVREIDEIQHPAVRAVLQWSGVKDGLEIHHDGDLPARSGLGSSSSFTVGLVKAIRALDGKLVSKRDLASDAINIEQDLIGENVGSQDQIVAAFGGLNRIEFHRSGEFDVDPVILPPGRSDEFQDHLMLFFTGLSRTASEIAKSQIENLAEREREIKRMMTMVNDGISILRAGSLNDFGLLLNEAWDIKKTLSHRITTDEIDGIYKRAKSAGAIGGKLLGAGGGGFILFFVEPAEQGSVREALSELIHVPFRFETSGSHIALYQPSGL